MKFTFTCTFEDYAGPTGFAEQPPVPMAPQPVVPIQS